MNLDPFIIQKRREAGESIPDLAASLGVSERRVYQLIGPQSVKPRLTDAEREARAAEIKRRSGLGDSRRKIADELGMSRRDVDSALGHKREAAESFTPEQQATIARMSAAGEAPARIADAIGRSVAGVKRVIDRDRLRDWIQDAVIARVVELGWDSARLSAETGLRVPVDHAQAFLARERPMGSHKLQHIFRAIGGSPTSLARAFR